MSKSKLNFSVYRSVMRYYVAYQNPAAYVARVERPLCRVNFTFDPKKLQITII